MSNAFLCNSRAVLHSTAIVYYLPLSQIFFKTEQIKWFPIQFIQFIQLKQLKPNFIVDYDHFYSHHLISTTSTFFSAMALILIPGNWKKDVWLDNQFGVFFNIVGLKVLSQPRPLTLCHLSYCNWLMLCIFGILYHCTPCAPIDDARVVPALEQVLILVYSLSNDPLLVERGD